MGLGSLSLKAENGRSRWAVAGAEKRLVNEVAFRVAAEMKEKADSTERAFDESQGTDSLMNSGLFNQALPRSVIPRSV